ncbi:gluconate kinase [Caulobacter sp. CCUG 60055]|nr:bifunctional aminoglycoside phosphotransferase/ATP-binding protein [Caulobacter sp. CCUG 60055]MBQ1542803.1 AAA family ATPase [Caulobacteraceae bacterium]MCI3181081.1 gluconate kinase [Caulobacter sp. CCUG 60055]
MKSEDHSRQIEVAAWLAERADKVIETSCASVYLVGDRALKVKKPVDFGYLDYSTLEKRHWALERELAFNCATAPDVYRGVRCVTRAARGGLEMDGAGPAVEYLLEMRRFDDEAVLSQRPWAIDDALEETLGRAVARFHAGAALRPESGQGALGYTVPSNAAQFRKQVSVFGETVVASACAGTDAALAAAAGLLERRRAAGFLRRCHGDLHLGNILIENGAPVLFDCIEFNDALSDMDVLYDLGFLLMDLDFRRRTDAANRVLNSYLDEAARSFPTAELYAGLGLLPLILSVRAGVRAQVSAHAGDAEAARAYMAAAIRHLGAEPASLTAFGGLSGSGKSTQARLAAPGLGARPGAVILRTDEIRKRLWGVGALDRLPAEAYAPEVGRRVYATLFDEAGACLAAGRAVVLDAVFLRPEERAQAEAVAKAAGAPFRGVWLEAAPDVLRGRVASRTGDASDADVAVLEAQLDRDAGEIGWERLDAEAPLRED